MSVAKKVEVKFSHRIPIILIFNLAKKLSFEATFLCGPPSLSKVKIIQTELCPTGNQNALNHVPQPTIPTVGAHFVGGQW
jgi:hypothetical protein